MYIIRTFYIIFHLRYNRYNCLNITAVIISVFFLTTGCMYYKYQ